MNINKILLMFGICFIFGIVIATLEYFNINSPMVHYFLGFIAGQTVAYYNL